MTDTEASQSAQLLADLRALRGNRAWVEMQGLLNAAKTAHLSGISDRNKTAEKRAEHLEGYHTASDLAGWLERRERELEGALQQHAQERIDRDGRGFSDED